MASTGRASERPYLKGLGAAEIIDRAELSRPAGRSARNAGPEASTRRCQPFANVLSKTKYGGASRRAAWPRAWTFRHRSRRSFCATSLLIGVDSVMCPIADREELAWSSSGQRS